MNDVKIHKTQTIIETMRSRIQDLTNVAAEIYGISLWQNWQAESWNNLSLRKAVHVFSDSVLCVGNNNAIANEAWARELSEVWDPMTFKDKHHITGQTSATPLGTFFQATQRPKS